jgi:hypothetical protein
MYGVDAGGRLTRRLRGTSGRTGFDGRGAEIAHGFLRNCFHLAVELFFKEIERYILNSLQEHRM